MLAEALRATIMTIKHRQIREARNERKAKCSFHPLRGYDFPPILDRGRPICEVAANPGPSAAGLPPAAAQTHRADERYGDLFAGGSRIALNQRVGAHSWRFPQ